MYWTAYSLKNRDLLIDSGTASRELKTNVAAYFVMLLICCLSLLSKKPALLLFCLPVAGLNAFINRNFFSALRATMGLPLAVLSAGYYLLVYPLAVGVGSVAGMVKYSLWLGRIQGMR